MSIRTLIRCRLLRRHEPTEGFKHLRDRVHKFVYCSRCRSLLAGESFTGQHPLPR